jgi:plastocyanin
MRAFRSKPVTVVLVTILAAACGGDGSGPTPEPRVLATVEVTPATATLFSAAPGNTVQVTVVAKDQDGAFLNDVGPASFSSADEAVATVGPDGTIAAAGAGTAQITASVTADGVTKTGTATVTVEDAPASASVEAPEFYFEPGTVDVSAGGTVTWTAGELPHTVTFLGGDAPASIPGFANESVSRTFPTSGTFEYACEFHSGMSGTVRVH